MRKIKFHFESWHILLVIAVFTAGLGLRLINLTNPPLDFHAWRQLRDATIARGIYYQLLPSADPVLREKATHLAGLNPALEPNIMETIVALVYVITGGEHLWIARLYSIIAWLIGGLGIYFLGKRLSTRTGGLAALAFYLFLPYGIDASRAFMPDPSMVMWIILSAWALVNWSDKRTWLSALLAGVFSGMAVLTKVFAVFPVGLLSIIIVLTTYKLAKAIKSPQVWFIAIVMVIIPSIYYIFSVGNLASGYISGWVIGFSTLLRSPGFYIRWVSFLKQIVDPFLLCLCVLSTFLYDSLGRKVMLGFFGGYFLIGITVPSLIITHDYYSLFIIPCLSLAIAPLAELITKQIIQRDWLVKILAIGTTMFLVGYALLLSRNSLVYQDFRPEAGGWIRMGRLLPQGSFIGITHDYNARLAYYGWTAVAPWPLVHDDQMNIMSGGSGTNYEDTVYWDHYFMANTKGYDYFIVTIMGELDAQPALKQILTRYPSINGEGYVLFDLKHPLDPSQQP
jgi:4-amino-4-deoxy-L-arabinose transferase-like glycosyltransferase